MLNNYSVGKYYVASSNIHKMHPLSKIICTVLFIIMAIFGVDIKTTIALSLLVLIMILNTSVPIKIFLRAIFTLRYIIFLMVLLSAIFQIPVEISVSLIINFTLVVLYTIILSMTSPPTELTYGFEMFLSPLKVFGIKTNQLALYMSMGLRFIPTLLDENARIIKAEASRGVDYHNSKMSEKIKIAKSLIKPTLFHAKEKTKQLMNFMNLRLFSLGKVRTNFRINKWRFFDSYLIIIHILILFVIVVRGILI